MLRRQIASRSMATRPLALLVPGFSIVKPGERTVTGERQKQTSSNRSNRSRALL